MSQNVSVEHVDPLPSQQMEKTRLLGPEKIQVGLLDASADLPYVPGYDVHYVLGRGGMGVVYKARHRSLKRLVALKMVRQFDLASPEKLMRFHLEAELAARVRHPNIVQVYEVGAYGKKPYLGMEWVAGGSLAQKRPATTAGSGPPNTRKAIDAPARKRSNEAPKNSATPTWSRPASSSQLRRD